MAAMVSSTAMAADAAAKKLPPTDDLLTAITNGSFWLDARYRDEIVHQAGIRREAEANTVRTILGYRTGEFKGFKVEVAGLNSMTIGNDTFNDGTNGRTNYPSIADPIDTQLHLANIKYTGVPDTTIVAGRQRFSFDNQRFIGQSAWRQIPISYDAVYLANKSLPDTELAYSYVFHNNRSGGSRTFNGTYGMAAHLFHAAYSGIKDVKFIGYSYLVDIENAKTLSSASHGMRIEGKKALTDDIALTGTVEYARQTDYGNNPNSYALNYYLIEPGVVVKGVKAEFNYEYLGGNGRYAMQTPLMSTHNMNGWTDKFSTIPVNGLKDAYVDLSYGFKLPVDWLGETKLGAQWHDYNAAHISQHYGNEWGLDFVQTIADHYTVGVQYTNYIADSYLTDTQKIIVTGQIKF